MKLYRYMCKEEFEETMCRERLNFNKKNKWFSDSLEWLNSRVKDGEFNNSKFLDGRYDYLVAIEFDSGSMGRFVKCGGWHEYMLNVRKSNFEYELICLVGE